MALPNAIGLTFLPHGIGPYALLTNARYPFRLLNPSDPLSIVVDVLFSIRRFVQIDSSLSASATGRRGANLLSDVA